MGIQTWQAASLGLLLTVGASRAAEPPLLTARSALQEWVQTWQLISRTQSDWRGEKESLEQSVAMFKSELKSLSAQLESVGTNRTQAAAERAHTEQQRAAFEAALTTLTERLAPVEERLRRLIPALPAPLHKTVQPLLDRLPADGDDASTPPVRRLQTMVTLLNEVGKFNSMVTLSSELRAMKDGRQVKVQVLYFGLGQAWFTDETGKFAGRGLPSSSGWEWSVEPTLGPRIQELIAIYEEKQPAAFLPLPVEIR